MNQSIKIQQLKTQPRLGAFDLGDLLTKVDAVGSALFNITDDQRVLTGLEKMIAENENLGKTLLELADRALYFEKSVLSLTKTFGITTTDALKLNDAFFQSAKGLQISNTLFKKYAGTIKSMLPTINAASKSQGKYYTGLIAVNKVLETNLKLTSKQAEEFSYYAVQSGRNAVVQLKTTQAAADQIEKVTKMQGAFKDITEAIGDSSATTQLQFGKIAGNLELAAIKGKALGFSLDEITGIGKSMLDIESSIGQELEYQLLTGRRLIGQGKTSAKLKGKSLTNAFREAAIAGDANKQAMALNEILEQEGKTLENNMFAREQMAKLLGIEENKLSRALQKKAALEEIAGSKEEARKLFELDDKALKASLKAQVDAGKINQDQFKNIAKMMDTRSTAEKMDEQIDLLNDIKIASFITANASGVSGEGPISQMMDRLSKSITGTPGVQGKLERVASLTLTRQQAEDLGSAQQATEKASIAASITSNLNTRKAKDPSGVEIQSDDDLISAGYGDRILITPDGAHALNNQDTVIAGTNLGKADDVVSGPRGSISIIDYNKMAEAMKQVTLQVNVDPKVFKMSRPK